jgi:hypothetical protein
MQKIKTTLLKRRKIVTMVLVTVAVLAALVNYFFIVTPPGYIPPGWRMPLVYLLIGYKLIELTLFYLFLYKKPYLKVIDQAFHTQVLEDFEKRAKKFFFLVPQGSIVFGILSYKLSGNIYYLWLFLLIALVVVVKVDPEKLEEKR